MKILMTLLFLPYKCNFLFYSVTGWLQGPNRIQRVQVHVSQQARHPGFERAGGVGTSRTDSCFCGQQRLREEHQRSTSGAILRPRWRTSGMKPHLLHIYIYAFNRCLYPKRFTVQSGTKAICHNTFWCIFNLLWNCLKLKPLHYYTHTFLKMHM